MADTGTIPQPLTSGTTDQPNAPQSGTPSVVPAPEGLSETPPQGPPPPEGLSETPPTHSEGESTDKGPNYAIPPDQQLGLGVAKAAGQTVSTLGHLGSNAMKYGTPYTPALGDNPISQKIDQGLKILDTATTPEGAIEKTGVLLEGLGEFFIGDEALKGLNVADRLGIAQKVMELGKKYPMFARLLGTGLQAVRQGTTAGAQSLAHGASAGEALHTAEGGALLGTMAGAGGQAIGEIGGKAGSLIKSLLTQGETQEFGQKGIRDLVDQTAQAEKVPTSKAASIRDHINETGESVEAKAKDLYKQIDDATGQPFIQNAMRKLNNIRRQIQSLAGTEEDVAQEARLEKARTETMDAIEDRWKEAQANGVPRTTLDEANRLFKKAQALYDLDAEIKRPNLVTGMRANEATAKQLENNPEVVNPARFNTAVNKLYDSGRLQEALGGNRAGSMLRHTNDFLAEHNRIALNQKIAKGIGKGLAVGAGLGAAGSIAHSVLSAPAPVAAP